MRTNPSSSHLNHTSRASYAEAACNRICRILEISSSVDSWGTILTSASTTPSAKGVLRFVAATMLADSKSLRFSRGLVEAFVSPIVFIASFTRSGAGSPKAEH